MKPTLPLLLLLVACPTPEEEPKGGDTAAEVTDTGDTDLGTPDDPRDDTGGGDEDAEWWGSCAYTVSAVGPDDLVDFLGGTPTEFAALVSGARSTTFHFDSDGIDTTLDHTLVVDASTAQLWHGEWVESDTTMDEDDTATGMEDGSGGEAPPGDPDVDTGASEPGDPGDSGASDTGASDTGASDTGTSDTGTWSGDDTGEPGPRCPDYLSAEADWSFATGDGSFAEAMRVTVQSSTLSIGRIVHTVDFAALAGTLAAPVDDPAAWDELRIGFAASVGADGVDFGEVAVFGSRVWSTSDDTAADAADDTGDDLPDDTGVAEAFMSNIARWPAPDGGE